MFTTNHSSIGQKNKEFATCFNKPKGGEVHVPNFWQLILIPIKKIGLVLNCLFFQLIIIKHVITILNVLCVVFWCWIKSSWIYSWIPQKKWEESENLYSKNKALLNILVPSFTSGLFMDTKKLRYQKMYVHIFMLKKILHYLDDLSSVTFDEEELIEWKNQWFFHIWYFNKEHIIKPCNVTLSNIF